MEKIFLISGRKQHGKDTVAKLIKFCILKNKIEKLSTQLPTFQRSLGLFAKNHKKHYLEIEQIIQLDCETYQESQIKGFIPEYCFSEQRTTQMIDCLFKDLSCGSWTIVQLSNNLKRIVSLLTGCTVDKLEYDWFKQSLSTIPKKDGFYTYRELLQYIGTDLFRDQINPTVWVDSYLNTRNNFINSLYDDNYTIISDWRFPNELERLKANKEISVVSLRVINPHKYTTSTEHISEKALDHLTNDKFDYVISNYSNLNALIFQIDKLLTDQKIINQTPSKAQI